ncbi:MAG: hypothetical protein LLF83_09495 [Methanobacterium sp.]|nr:hypothetical protein [Methanobacterium sp.]
MRKILLLLAIVVFILGGLAYYYYDNAISASHFSNGNISFDYPQSFTLDKNPVASENSNGYFVAAFNSPSHKSAIIIYEIPRKTIKNVTTNQSDNVSTNNTIFTLAAYDDNSTNNTTVNTTKTIEVNVDNLQVYLDLVSIRSGNPLQVFKNNYTYYVSGNLKTPLVSYNNSSRTGKLTIVFVNETAIVKDSFSNFYVVELLNGDTSDDAGKAYNQIVNTLRIIGS